MAKTRLCIDFETEGAAADFFARTFPGGEYALYRMDGFDEQHGAGGITSVHSLIVRAPGVRPDFQRVQYWTETRTA
jgi:hypothetical protein